MRAIRKQATVCGNCVIARRKADGTWSVVIVARDERYGPMKARNVQEVGCIAFEMADNNDIGRDLANKIIHSLYMEMARR